MPSKKKSKDDGQGLIIAREFLQLSKAVTEALKSTGYLPDINGIASGSRTETPSPVSSSGSPEPGPSHGASLDTMMGEEERYVAVMQPLQYDSLEFASECDNPLDSHNPNSVQVRVTPSCQTSRRPRLPQVRLFSGSPRSSPP